MVWGLLSSLRGNKLKLHLGKFKLDIGEVPSWNGLSSTVTGCPGMWGNHHPWRDVEGSGCGIWGLGLVVGLALAGLG